MHQLVNINIYIKMHGATIKIKEYNKPTFLLHTFLIQEIQMSYYYYYYYYYYYFTVFL